MKWRQSNLKAGKKTIGDCNSFEQGHSLESLSQQIIALFDWNKLYEVHT